MTMQILGYQLPQFSSFIELYGAIGIFIWFLTFDNLTPLPAEISLIIIGYLVAHNAFQPAGAMIASFLGLISVDIIYFWLTHSGNNFIMKLFNKKQGKFLDRYKKSMQTKMPQTLILLIFIPRMRMFGPILAALTKCSFKRFLFFDAIGLAGFVITFVFLGIIFHNSLSKVLDELSLARHLIFGVSMLILTLFIIIIFRRWKIKRNS